MAHRANRPQRPPRRRGDSSFQKTITAPPVVNGYSAQILSPPRGSSSPDQRIDVTVLATAVTTPTLDIQMEWRRQEATQATVGGPWSPAATYTNTVTGLTSNQEHVIEPPTDLAYGTWWYRARAGDSSTGVWGAWSVQVWSDVRPTLGSVTQYIDLNIGVDAPPLEGAFAYIDLNIGIRTEDYDASPAAYIDLNLGVEKLPLTAVAYSDLNVGIERKVLRTVIYSDMNVRSDMTPVPHLWWVRPERGKHGYVFNIFGQGFGSFQNEFSGSVMLGNHVCPIVRWDLVPAGLKPVTVSVKGTPRTTSSTTALPVVLLNPSALLIEAGDIIEYDMKWDTPPSTQLDILPTFDISTTTSKMGYGTALLNDTTGDPWISAQPEAYGAWHHRKFVVPSGNFLVGKTISNFGIAWYGFSASAPERAGSIRSFVVRDSQGVPKLWVTGDDHQSAPALTYTANGGALVSATFEQEGFEIIHGQGLDPDTITPEHGWIVAVVPSGAVSSMVRVVLEE